MFIQPRSDEDHKNLIEQGFTLVELLIVVVILGILAGIVVFAVGNLTDTATNHACATEASTFQTAWNAYKAQNKGVTIGGANAPAAAVLLANNAPATGGPLLQSGTLSYQHATPGASDATWDFNTTTEAMTKGGKCV